MNKNSFIEDCANMANKIRLGQDFPTLFEIFELINPYLTNNPTEYSNHEALAGIINKITIHHINSDWIGIADDIEYELLSAVSN